MTRGQSDGKKNFYAITKGRRTGIFKGSAWSEVKHLVDKYPGGAYKGFVTLEEAMEFMKKGGFNDSDIFIYDIANDGAKSSVETEPMICGSPDQGQANGEVIDTSETHLKFYDAKTSNDNDHTADPENGIAPLVVTENIQITTTDVVNLRKTHCVICTGNESKEMLQCSACNGRVHLTCSGLPKYQIQMFRNTQRKFTCQPCVENSDEIKMKDARKSYTELIQEETSPGLQVPPEINSPQPIASTQNIPPKTDDITEIKREILNVSLTLTNFEQEILKVVLQMRDENLSLREKLCDEKVRNANAERDTAVKQSEKAENKVRDLEIQNNNLRERIMKVQTECENLRTSITRHSEVKNTLNEKIGKKDEEIVRLREECTALSTTSKKEPVKITTDNERDNECIVGYTTDVKVSNRYEPLTRTEVLKSSIPSVQGNVTYVEGHMDPLSNFFRTKFRWNRTAFNSLEQAFQYEKAMRHRDGDAAERILRSRHAGIAQRIGRNVRRHPDWDKDKEEVMNRMLKLKYQQCEPFRRALHRTGNNKIVQNTADRFWGIGTDRNGLNKMGSMLEALRQHETTEERQSAHPEKPSVAIFGSSLIKNMEAGRVSRNFRTDIQMSYTIPEAKRNISEYKRKADVVVYQVLSNDIMEKSVNECVEEMKELVETTKKSQQSARIIISLPTNRGDSVIFNNKINSVNASVKIEFQDADRVHISDNSNLSYRGEPNRKMINPVDGVHPTAMGERVLFQTSGRRSKRC